MQEFTNTENEKKFIGVWKLDEWSVEKPNGNKTYPFAGDVSGYKKEKKNYQKEI